MHPTMPPVRPMHATAGGQLTTRDVVGRDEDVTRAWQMLEGASLRLNEPRRLGKTSVLTKMAESPPARWECAKISLQGVETVDQMALTLLAAVHQHQRLPKRAKDAAQSVLTAGKLSAQMSGITWELSAAFHNDPLSALEAALVDVSRAMRDQGQRLLLACDEVPDMLLAIERRSPGAAENVLAVLRRFRDQDARSSVRWLLTGSVGMHHVMRTITAGDDLIGDLDTIHLGPLSDNWACWLAQSLLLGAKIDYEPGTPAEVVRIAGGIPYLVHLIIARGRDRQIRFIKSENVDKIFLEAVGDLDTSQQSTHLLTRLQPYYDRDTQAAEWLLDKLAESAFTRPQLQAAASIGEEPLLGETRLRSLLDWLCLDHYIVKGSSGSYNWRYPPLQRIWQLRRA